MGITCYIDLGYKIAVGLMAICNFVLTIYIFFFNKNTNQRKEEKNDRQRLLCILVLNHKMSVFYNLFDKIQQETSRLKKETVTDNLKSEINETLESLFSDFRKMFAEPVGAIDNNLYKRLMERSDMLQSDLSHSLFDKGVNLDVDDKFSSLIEEPIIKAQREMISILYKFL